MPFIQFLVVPYFLPINFLLKKRKTTGHHLTLPKQIFIVCRIISANFKLILLQLEFKIHHKRYNNFSHSSRCCATSLANYAAMRGIKKKEKYFGFFRSLGRSIYCRRKSQRANMFIGLFCIY